MFTSTQHHRVAAKGPAIAEMLFTLESGRALYYRAISEARVDAPLEAVQRARAAHVTMQRAVVAVTQEAIRVCGGRAFLKRYPLERYARDARAAALMRPWTRDAAGPGERARPGWAAGRCRRDLTELPPLQKLRSVAAAETGD